MTLAPMTTAEIAGTALRSGATALGGFVTAWLVGRTLGAVADRLKERTATELDERILAAVRGPASWAVALFFLLYAVRFWPWDPGTNGRLAHGSAAVVAFLVFFTAVRIVGLLLSWYVSRTEAGESGSLASLLRKVLGTAIWAVGLLYGLDQLGYEVGPLLASLGIVGVAVGLGMQETLSGLFAGLYVMLDRSLATGDYIQLASGEEGFVRRIGWRSTLLRTADGQDVIIPNVNMARTTMRKLPPPGRSVTIRAVAEFGTDPDRLEEACLATARGVGEGEAKFALSGFPGGGLGFELSVDAREGTDTARLAQDLRRALYRSLVNSGIPLVG